MNRVTYPLKPGSDGPAVTDLQAALTALLERGAILPDGPDDRRALTRAIAREAGRYGDGTAKAVSVAQDEAGLQATGAVDEKTAARLNALLDQLGLPGPACSGPRIIAGQVLGDPLPRGLTVLAFLEPTPAPCGWGPIRSTPPAAMRSATARRPRPEPRCCWSWSPPRASGSLRSGTARGAPGSSGLT